MALADDHPITRKPRVLGTPDEGVRPTQKGLSSPVLAANGGKPLRARQIYCQQSWHILPMPYDILKGRGVKNLSVDVGLSLFLRHRRAL